MADNNVSIQAAVSESVIKDVLKKIQKSAEKYPVELKTNFKFDINSLTLFGTSKIREALSDLQRQLSFPSYRRI